LRGKTVRRSFVTLTLAGTALTASCSGFTGFIDENQPTEIDPVTGAPVPPGSNGTTSGGGTPGASGGSVPGPGGSSAPGGSATGTGSPSGTGTGTGGAPASPPSASNAAVSCPAEPLPVAGAAVRLTDKQFRNTVASLFPFAVDVGNKYPTSTAAKDGFTTTVTANQVLFNDIQSFAETAESIALQAVARIAQILPCTPTAATEAACARQFVETFGAKAFRRPLEATERDRLVALYDTVRRAPEALDFSGGIAAVIAGVLQSPQFLYRLEPGTVVKPGVRKLTAYEVAARLSYLYWDSPPDAALLEKARTNALGTAAAIETEARRLLADPKARDSAWRFFSEWLGFGDKLMDSRVDRALAADFAEEARRFVTGVVFDNPAAPVRDLLDNDKTFVNNRLARHYGLPATGASDTEWRQVTLPAAMKAGVLSKAQVAAAHSPVNDTSVILRGKFVNDRFMCFELGAPPPGVQAMNPVLPAGATPRQRMDARMNIAQCATCHRFMDNAGIGLEDFDHLGRPRAAYADGKAVDANGRLMALEGADQSFVGTAGLAKKLASSEQFAGCISRQWYRYATGHHETDAEARCHVNRMAKRFADSGYNVRELLLSMSGSDAFLYRSGP
jgi:hypothetical protein